jgi:branched-chain amino acid aminotransferase
MGISTEIGPISKEEFFSADEVFFSGTAVEIAPIIRVMDDSDPNAAPQEHTIGSGKVGKITEKLAEAYKQIVTGADKAYQEWLTYVHD